MRYFVFTVVSCVTVFQSIECANILGLFPFPGKSHFIMFERLLIELAARGHNVDVYSQFTRKEPLPPTYNQISLKGTVSLTLVNSVPIAMFRDMNTFQMINFITKTSGVEICQTLFNHAEVKKLKNSNKKYDVVISEIFGSDCALGFSYWFKAPSIVLTSSVPLPWVNDRVGNPDNPSYIPNYFMDTEPEIGLLKRVENTLYLLSSKALYNYWSSKESNRLAREFFGEHLPKLEDLALNTSLILSNSHFSINPATPVVPNLIGVGGLHITEPKPLPSHLENFLQLDNDEYKGVIYLTMGSMIMTETIPMERLQGMFDAFAQLPYKVLWKAQKHLFDKNLKIPSNIHFEPWMPQIDVLCHPNVKMFVTHGGLMGSQEAIYCGVPLLGIPLFADQESNVRNLVLLGVCERVGYEEITKATILAVSKSLLYDTKYQENARKASELFKDRPLSAIDTATYWVEYIIRHQGAPNLRSAGRNLNWFQYHLFDVAIILILAGLLIIYLITRIIRFLIKLILCKLLKTKTD